MKNRKIDRKKLELYLSGQRERLNFRLLLEFGIPVHSQDSVLWVEDVKIIIHEEGRCFSS